MSRTSLSVSVCVLASVAGSLHASTVEFRIVERRNQVAWNPFIAYSVPLNDNILNLAVQARVVGGAPGEALGNFGFNMIMSGEAEGSGSLTRAKISIAGSANYDTGPTQYNTNSTLGQGGLASSYTYLAGLSGAFNGVINASTGSWTQTPNQDIGLIKGSPTGGAGLLAYGFAGHQDSSGNPVPDTWVSGTTATLDPVIAQDFLGADGNFIDVYHFNYTMSNLAARMFTFTLTGLNAQTFTSLASSDNVWGPANPVDASSIIVTYLSFGIPAPSSGAMLGISLLLGARRRRNG